MADRLFERAFERAAAVNAEEEAQQPLKPRKQTIKAEAGAAAPPVATPMQISDAIQRVLLADWDKDYFRYLLQVCQRSLTSCFCSNAAHLLLWRRRQVSEILLTVRRLMELPLPEADELGRPVWSVTSADISKAYRRLSVLVHPDKNPGEDARKAFEALNAAHRKLRDPGQLVCLP